MRRRQIHKGPKAQRERTWIEALPLDPRDADIIRAKEILRSKENRRATDVPLADAGPALRQVWAGR
jgi:hypothetical protein